MLQKQHFKVKLRIQPKREEIAFSPTFRPIVNPINYSTQRHSLKETNERSPSD